MSIEQSKCQHSTVFYWGHCTILFLFLPFIYFMKSYPTMQIVISREDCVVLSGFKLIREIPHDLVIQNCSEFKTEQKASSRVGCSDIFTSSFFWHGWKYLIWHYDNTSILPGWFILQGTSALSWTRNPRFSRKFNSGFKFKIPWGAKKEVSL